jgi:uroporphyrinogen decarboxylase
MPKETMTPAERWRAVLGRRTPDRLPLDYWGTDETTALLKRHLRAPTKRKMLEKLHVDFLVEAKPVYAGPRHPPLTDVFGCRFEIGYGPAAASAPPPAGGYSSVERSSETIRPSRIGGLRDPEEDRASSIIRSGRTEPFTYFLRGHEQALIDQ